MIIQKGYKKLEEINSINRLKVLEKCNCEEYDELKQVIDGTKKSKY